METPDRPEPVPGDQAGGGPKVVGPPPGPTLHVILVEPEIAANTGTIGRTCVAAGAMLWLVRPLGFRLDDRHRRRAGLDYWDHLAWQAVDRIDEAAGAIGPDRLWYFSTRAATPYTDAVFQPGDGLVFGPESRGLPARWLAAHADRALRIPMRAEARSLNLSNAVAIAVYEAIRQFRTTGASEGPGAASI